MEANSTRGMQSNKLQSIIDKHQLHPEYTLALSPIYMDKESFKNLSTGSILLTDSNFLELQLLKNGKYSADVELNIVSNIVKINIVNVEESLNQATKSLNYKKLLLSFGVIKCRKLEVGHKVALSSFNTTELKLLNNSKDVALVSLVSVEEKIALKVDEILI